MTRDERERLDDIWEALQRIRKTMSSGPQTPEAEAIAHVQKWWFAPETK